MPSIPKIDADYLSQALGSPVESFRIESIGSREGYMSNLYRITLAGAALPDSVILKLPSNDPEKLALATRFNSYGREQYFYRTLAARSTIRHPRCYFNADNEFLLLLEDVGHWPVVDVAAGANLIEATIAVTQLARLHASYWMTPPEAVEDFSTGFEVAAVDMSSFVLECIGELSPTSAVKFMRQYARESINHLSLFTEQKQVFSHMDYRLDNMRISDDDLILFDWGECSLAPPGFDLAYFMTTSLTSQNRRAWEDTLLRTYQKTLALHGIQYSHQALYDSYRLALPPGFYLAALVLTSGHKDDGLMLAERCLAAIADHLPFAREHFGNAMD